MTRSLTWAAFVLLPVLAITTSAAAISIKDPDQPSQVIQNRSFQMAHEIALQGGLLPLDAYYKGVSGALSYTWHFNDFNAWQIFHVGYSFNWDSRLKRALVEEFGASPTADYEFREAVVFVDSNYVLKPFYGKMAFFNRTIARSELEVMAGPVFMLFTPSSTDFSGMSYRPGVNYGMALRLFVSEWFSTRLELRHYIVVAADALFLSGDDQRVEIDNVLLLGLSACFNLGYD